jgi:hypothetical protein
VELVWQLAQWNVVHVRNVTIGKLVILADIENPSVGV